MQLIIEALALRVLGKGCPLFKYRVLAEGQSWHMASRLGKHGVFVIRGCSLTQGSWDATFLGGNVLAVLFARGESGRVDIVAEDSLLWCIGVK